MRSFFAQSVGAFAGVIVLGAIVLLTGFSPAQRFETINVGRINVREPDGTLRMVISSAAQAPGIIVKGHEQPHPSRRSAGMIFFNEEGTENGGLIFDGKRDSTGVHGGGSLTFDRYEQDQVVQVLADEDGTTRSAGVVVNDQPEELLDYGLIEKGRLLSGPAQAEAFKNAHAGEGSRRAFLGRNGAGDSQVVLSDAKGIKRLVLRVAPDGTAMIEFLDAGGQVTRRIDANAAH
jgi:hypothetical protein